MTEVRGRPDGGSLRTRRAGDHGLAVVAVDVGGSSIKGASMSQDGRTLVERTVGTPAGRDVMSAVLDLVGELTAGAALMGHAVVGVGVVTPGLVDDDTGLVRYAANLQWTDQPLRTELAAATGLPVATGHDVRTAGLAEQLFGAARGYDDFVLVPIGTGIAAASWSGGRAGTGATGATGELGHVPVLPGGEACPCGQRGCLEVYASGGGINRRYRALTGRDLTAEEIARRLETDEHAQVVWGEAVHALALGLTTCTLLLDPDVFIIGGGVAAAGEKLLGPLRAAVATQLSFRTAPTIRAAELGGTAARIGAAVLALRAVSLGHLVDSWDRRLLTTHESAG